MNNFSLLSDSELLLKTKNCVADERRAMTEVLWHLHEIDSRKLFAARGFSSLFEYAMLDLGYSEGAASRRVGAMRLLHSLPAKEKMQIESALNQGQVSLSTLSSVQRFCRSEKLPVAKKIEIVQKALGKSQRETDRMLASLSPEPFKVEKTRPLSETLTELRVTLTNEQLAKLERAKEILSNKTNTWAELFEAMAELVIKKPKPKSDKLNKSAPSETPVSGLPSAPQVDSSSLSPTPLAEISKPVSRYIPRGLKQQKFAAANDQCEYTDPITRRRCSARTHLEIDHIQPLALGGTTTANNLRVLCQAHNQFQALKSFGRKKMETHWALQK